MTVQEAIDKLNREVGQDDYFSVQVSYSRHSSSREIIEFSVFAKVGQNPMVACCSRPEPGSAVDELIAQIRSLSADHTKDVAAISEQIEQVVAATAP